MLIIFVCPCTLVRIKIYYSDICHLLYKNIRTQLRYRHRRWMATNIYFQIIQNTSILFACVQYLQGFRTEHVRMKIFQESDRERCVHVQRICVILQTSFVINFLSSSSTICCQKYYGRIWMNIYIYNKEYKTKRYF